MINRNTGLEYKDPVVTLIGETGIGVAEIAARTCYDSFDKADSQLIKEAGYQLSTCIGQDHYDESYRDDVSNLEDSKLLSQLSWVHHHHSIIEHASLQYYIKGIGRGVLQEHARHRLQNISVRSTRYTMSNVLISFLITKTLSGTDHDTVLRLFDSMLQADDVLIHADNKMHLLETEGIYKKLDYLYTDKIGKDNFLEISLSKEQLGYYTVVYTESTLSNEDALKHKSRLMKMKMKRNVGDNFKDIVTDTWATDLVVTFNLRSLRNYFELRDSGAAWFQIRRLAKLIKEVTPIKYLKLIDKEYKDLDNG